MADPNIALNKATTASGFVMPYEPKRAVDGSKQPTNRWLYHTVPASMTVDLGSTSIITLWTVKHMGEAGWRSPDYNMSDFAVQGSIDNANWVTIQAFTNNTASSNSGNVACAYRFVRVLVTKGLNTNTRMASIMELEVYGHAPNASLGSLSISSGLLTPTFAPATLAYTAPKVPYGTTSVVVSATAADPTSVIQVNGAIMTGGQSTVNLNVGINTINVLVTALDGVTKKTYTITVEREQGAVLSGLTISSGTLDPTFSSSGLNYTTQNVVYDTISVTVTPTTNIPGCTITVGGNPATSGQPSTVNLAVGSNTINIVVTNGAASQTYKITVVRENSLYLDRVNLTYTGTRFTFNDSVDMNQTTFDYTATVSTKAINVVITPIAEDNSASVTITSNGSSQTIASGTASSAISLPNAVNTISLVVSKLGATGTKNYTLTINRV